MYYQSISDFDMIQDGDRVLVCLSGGKDSLSLLHSLKQYQYIGKTNVRSITIGRLSCLALDGLFPRVLCSSWVQSLLTRVAPGTTLVH